MACLCVLFSFFLFFGETDLLKEWCIAVFLFEHKVPSSLKLDCSVPVMTEKKSIFYREEELCLKEEFPSK